MTGVRVWVGVWDRARVGIDSRIRVWNFGKYRTTSWVVQLHALSYHWAWCSPGAIFPSVARRAPGPRGSWGPWRPSSSILPLISLKEMGPSMTLRRRGRGSGLQREASSDGRPDAFALPALGRLRGKGFVTGPLATSWWPHKGTGPYTSAQEASRILYTPWHAPCLQLSVPAAQLRCLGER